MRIQLIACSIAAVCTACSQDICHEAASIAQSEVDQLSACSDGGSLFGDGGITDAEIQMCETQIAKCTSADQASISNYLNCASALPSFQCKWLTETTPDPSLTAYENDAAKCEAKTPMVSAACPYYGGLGSTNGGTTGGTTGGPTWSHTYNVESGSYFDNGYGSATVSGTETITQSGTTVMISGLGSPALVGCNLSLTLTSSTSTDASLTGTPTCSGIGVDGGLTTYTFQSAYAYLSPQGSMAYVDIDAQLTDSAQDYASLGVYLLSQ